MKNQNQVYPKISTKNKKLGECIPTINLPAGASCREDAPCYKYCYAKHGKMAMKNPKECYQKNLDSYIKCPDAFFGIIDATLNMIPYKYFRYHSAGDIPDEKYLDLMCKLARKHKETQFLCFTKKYEIVNNYLDNHKKPKNLVLVLSNWGDWVCPNPHKLPTAWVDLKNQTCLIPSDANHCSGYCGDCVNTDGSCWKLKKGESIVFKQH